jgi:type I site-specific restriction endonuclease
VEIYDNRWENATATMKSVKDEMTVKLDTIRNNFTLVSSMVSEKTAEALRLFWGDLDVAKAMTMINRYEAQKREIEQRMAEQQRKDREAEEERQRLNRERELEREKQKVRDEELARIRRENEIREEAQRQAREEEEAKTRAREQAEREALSAQKWTNASNIVTATYTIKAIPAELEQIEMYFNSIGVEFEKEDK